MMISAEEFINATVHEKPVVQISRLKDAYWQSIYQGARRPAGSGRERSLRRGPAGSGLSVATIRSEAERLPASLLGNI